MKKKDVEIGATYVAKVSGKLARVRIDRESPYGGWDATNVETKRRVRIKSAQRLRYPARPRQRKRDDMVAVAPPHEGNPADQQIDAPDDEYAGDPDVCATVGCDQPAALTYLGRPRCQECYEDEVADDNLPDRQAGQTSDETSNPEETEMGKQKKTTQKSTKNTAKRANTESSGDAKPKRLSAIDAAAKALQTLGKPTNCKTLIAIMAEQGLWESPNGKTPEATLHAAIMREIKAKGGEARFRKVERGQFEFAGKEV